MSQIQNMLIIFENMRQISGLPPLSESLAPLSAQKNVLRITQILGPLKSSFEPSFFVKNTSNTYIYKGWKKNTLLKFFIADADADNYLQGEDECHDPHVTQTLVLF